MALIQFTRNYADHSTDRGFQFEFYCDRCGNGYRTQFQSSASGMLSEALDVAGGLLGGILSTAANVGGRVHSAGWQKARDDAYTKAAAEAQPHFAHCPRCGQWVCRDTCWNNERGLCKSCAPDTEVEFSAAQVQARIQQGVQAINESTYITEQDKARLAQGNSIASCPSCGAPLNAVSKFCPECGAPLQQDKFCTECGAKVPVGSKFCPECGKKQG